MKSKQLGTSQAQVPEVGFGTWNYTGGIEPLRAAINQGACLIDTAESYGTEETVGEALRGLRQQVFLATKASPRNFRRRDLIGAADRSLRRLGTDYIDLYQLHWPNYVVPIEETMAAMEDLVQAGKIRFIGVSNFPIRDLRKAQGCLLKNRIVSNQVRYSLIDRTIEQDLLNYCQRNQITVVAFSPLGADFSRFRSCDPEGVLAQVADVYGKTPAQVALNWLISKPNVVAIPKASTVTHTIENCAASGWQLSLESLWLLENKIRYRRRSPMESAARRCARHLLQLAGRNLN